MSAFGDRFVALRNRAEAEIESAWTALEPELESAAYAAAKAGVAAAVSKGGSAGDMWVAARNAAESILTAQGKSIGGALLNEFVTQQMSATPAAT